MKNWTLLAPLIFFNCLIISCSGEPRKTIPEAYKAGKEYFHRKCAGCHGVNAMGGNRAPKLIQEIYSSNSYSDEKMSNIILNGSSSGAMPSLKGKVTDEEIEEIIKYIRHSQKVSGFGL